MKRIVLAVATLMAVVTAAVWFAAEESYVLNVEANVGTALNVDPHGTWNLRNVFAQESFDLQLTVRLSDHFVKETQPPAPQVTGLTYNIGCQAKAGVSNLCPHITLTNNTQGGVVQCAQAQVFCQTQVKLDKANPSSVWQVLVTIPDCVDAHQKDPGKKDIACTQDFPEQTSADVFVMRLPGKLIQGTVPCVDNKKGTQLPVGCTPK